MLRVCKLRCINLCPHLDLGLANRVCVGVEEDEDIPDCWYAADIIDRSDVLVSYRYVYEDDLLNKRGGGRCYSGSDYKGHRYPKVLTSRSLVDGSVVGDRGLSRYDV